MTPAFVQLALGLAGLLGEAVMNIMKSADMKAEDKAKVLADIRLRAQLDNAIVQGAEIRTEPPNPAPTPNQRGG